MQLEKTKPMTTAPPPSPLKFIATYDNNTPGSPLPWQRIESPVSQEDEEVVAIVKQGELTRHTNLRQCDSVLQDVEETGNCFFKVQNLIHYPNYL